MFLFPSFPLRLEGSRLHLLKLGQKFLILPDKLLPFNLIKYHALPIYFVGTINDIHVKHGIDFLIFLVSIVRHRSFL